MSRYLAEPRLKNTHLDNSSFLAFPIVWLLKELMRKITFTIMILQVLPRLKSFAPWHYFLKVFVLLAVSFGLEFYIHSTGSYVWYLMMPLGFLFALIGELNQLSARKTITGGFINKQNIHCIEETPLHNNKLWQIFLLSKISGKFKRNMAWNDSSIVSFLNYFPNLTIFTDKVGLICTMWNSDILVHSEIWRIIWLLEQLIFEQFLHFVRHEHPTRRESRRNL